MTQYNMKHSLKYFGQSGVNAIEKEVRQLFRVDALEPNNPKELSKEYCRAAMAYLMLLKEKQDRTIKSQGYCDRRI